MNDNTKGTKLFDWAIIRPAIVDSFRKLSPRRQFRNPVMFVVLVGSVLTSLLFVQAIIGKGEAGPWFILGISLWLWFTVLFANFAEAMAEGHGRAQADSLRKARKDLVARKLANPRRDSSLRWFWRRCWRLATWSWLKRAILFPSTERL